MFYDGDVSVFLADFGVPAVIAGNAVTVIFDNEFMAGLDIESSNPVALAASNDVASVVHGDPVVISGVNHTVVGKKPDGTGFTLLELEVV